MRSSNVKSEIQQENKARPYLCYVFTYLVLYNYGLYPLLKIILPTIPYIPLPPEFWETMMICVGGYVAGRTVEKSIKSSKLQ